MPNHKTPSSTAASGWLIWASSALLFLLALPLLALAAYTLSEQDAVSTLISKAVLSAMALSLATTAISIVLIIILGTPMAYLFGRYSFRFKSILTILVELPIVMPPVVAGLALLMAFGRRGLLGSALGVAGIALPFSTAAVVIAQVFVAAPYFVRTAQVSFQSISREIEHAASIDGADGLRMFWYVMLPLSRRGIVVGLVLSWARALGEFGATILFAGNLQGRTQTMPLLVYGAMERDLGAALWAGLVLIVMAIMALGLARWLSKSIDNEIDTPTEL